MEGKHAKQFIGKAYSFVDKAKLFVQLVFLRFGLPIWGTNIRFQLRNDTFVTIFLRTVSDIEVARAIFVKGEYSLLENVSIKQNAVIWDLGANAGITTAYMNGIFKKQEPIFVAVEPDVVVSKTLEKNCELNNISCTVMNAVVSDSEEPKTLFMSRTRSMSNSLTKRKNDDIAVDVTSIVLNSLYEKNRNTDIVKFDIEGSEYEAFVSFKYLNEISYYIGEIHVDLADGWTLQDFLSLFSAYKVQCIPHKKEGRYDFFAQKKN